MSAVQELAARLRAAMREEARRVSPPVRRFKVRRRNPLVVEEMGGDLILEEGDPDVEIDRATLADRPLKDDLVRVHVDEQGDYIIGGVIDG